MDIQPQHQLDFQMTEGDLQKLVALVVQKVALLEGNALSHLKNNGQYFDEVVQWITPQLHQELQTQFVTSPVWTVEEKGIDDIFDENDIEFLFSAETNNEELRTDGLYTCVMRDGEIVLHLFSQYYDSSVLEAAKKDDLQPFPKKGYAVATSATIGSRYLGQVIGAGDDIPNVREVIRSIHERDEEAYRNRPSILNKTEPTISQAVYRKGERKARKDRQFPI